MLVPNKKKLYTLAVILAGSAIYMTLLYSRTQPVKRPPPPMIPPLVEVITAHPVNHKLVVRAQGNIQPRHEIDLVAQVTGKIIGATSDFSNGSFFQDNDVLINIEQVDYLVAEQQAKAKVANAEQFLAEERGRVRQAKREWRDLGNNEANNLFLRKPQLHSAETALESAKATLNKASLDVKRTQITAPFSGRIRQSMVNVGQYVTTGTKLARIYSTDIAEVRLPLTDRQAAKLDLSHLSVHPPSSQHSTSANLLGLPVLLKSNFAGKLGSWQANLVRTDASINIENRQLFVVAQIKNPFLPPANNPTQPTLNIGQYVEAYIEGKVANNVLVLPRKALRPQNRIWIMGSDQRLQIKQVTVLQNDYEQVVVQNDFTEPQQVIISNMSLAVEGMTLTTNLADINAKTQATKPSSTEAQQ